jgi:hypothetical protein
MGIRNSLGNPEGEDFWWLNNGITIVASKAVLSSKTLSLVNPQIVNGHQTSVEVHEHFRRGSRDNDERGILVRVIVPSSDDSHRRIIRATNSQTVIPVAFLRATDEIHRNIEDFFKVRGYYYDRRKNSYKNDGKPRDKIVGVPYVAQAVMAVLLGRPDDARARPSTLLKKDEDYETVFDPKCPLPAYLACVRLMKRVEDYLRGQKHPRTAKEMNNIKFHLAFFVARLHLGKGKLSPGDLEGMNCDDLNDEILKEANDLVDEVFMALGGDDQTSKGREFVSELEDQLKGSSRIQNRT